MAILNRKERAKKIKAEKLKFIVLSVLFWGLVASVGMNVISFRISAHNALKVKIAAVRQ